MMPLESAKEIYFPNLDRGDYRVTSPESEQYNCIAWAAGDTEEWWSPLTGNYWPQAAPREVTLESFRAVFESLGYRECANDTSETGFEKVAIYVNGEGLPTHAARQLENGNWTSKLGYWQDIEHASLRALENAPLMDSLYGTVALLMRRPRIDATA